MQELDKFFDSLLNETFTIIYHEKKFILKKRYPTSILQDVMNKNKIAQMSHLISYLSQDPKIPLSKIGRIPADLLGLIGQEIKKYNQDVLSGEAPRTSPPTNP